MPINVKAADGSLGGNIFNAPTNPYLSDVSPTDGDRIYTAITTEDTSVSITGWGGTITENSNLNTTKGFRIKCYDSLTTTGIRFNPTATNLNDNDFFVLIYSDKPYQHHFAKITEVLTEDEYGDAFEFEPKLGNEIPKDTKFIIFQMTKNGSVVAVSMGMLQDDSLGSSSNDFEGELWRRMAVARPLFYFFPRETNADKMDKPNELNHNRKFYAIRESGTANSYTLSNADNCQVFTTMQDFGKSVVDYSKFSYKITLTDKLRDLDATQVSSPNPFTTNEGTTITAGDDTNYNASHYNARRITNDVIAQTPTFTGPLRYLSYDFSPTKSNLVHGVYDHTNTEAIDGKGGFSETSIVDNNRIMPRKIKEFDAYRVRHTVHRGETNEFFALKATYDSSATDVAFTFNTEYDLKTVLNAGDEVKLGNDILFVDDDGSGNPAISTLSGTTQTITFEHNATRVYARTESEGKFTLKSITPTSGETLHRRAYNATDGTLMLDTKLLNGRFSKMYVAFTSLNHEQRFATITACDATKGMITLSFSDDSYTANPLSFIRGQYQLLIERFNGEVENIESKKQDGQTIMEIQGRDKFSKLLSPIVNLNTLFSDDVIYSTNSPYNKLTQIDSTNFTVALRATSLATGVNGADFDRLPVVGDKLFTVNGFIGEVSAVDDGSGGTGDPKTIHFSAAITQANSEKIYVESEKNYVLSKAIGSSHLTTNKPTSLTGAANKGLVFTSGNKLASDGTKSESLVSSSANTNEGAIGYAINKPSSISSDFAFQSLLKDEHGSAGASSFDTVNTLIDFEIVSTTKKDNITEIELAPYIPATLGRLADYHDDTRDYTFTDLGTAGSSTSSKVKVTSSNAYALLKGDSIFVRTGSASPYTYTFIGNVLKIEINTTSSVDVDIYLDRNNHGLTITGATIAKATKPNSELTVVNGAHLWGGKILIHPHPQGTADGLFPLNIDNTTGSADLAAKFGQMYYRVFDVAKGDFGANKPVVASGNDFFPHYYSGKHNLSYLLSGYKIKPNLSSTNITNFGTTDSSHRLFPLDIRGETSPFGSNMNNTRIYQTSKDLFPIDDGLNIKAKLQDFDISALRKFIYITGDYLPYSSLRTDSLLHESSGSMTKNINDYNLFLIENKNVADVEITGGRRNSLVDSNFQTISFETDKDLSTLKRFGLMRLTEVCYDYLFNPVNPEQPIIEKYENTVDANIKNYDIDNIVDSGGTNLTGTFTDGGGSPSVTFSATPSPALSGGDKIYDRKGRFIAEINATSSGNVYALSANPIRTEDGSLPSSSQTLYKIAESNSIDIKGRNEADTSFQLTDNALHPLKAAVLPESSHYGEDSNDKIRIRNNDSDVHIAEQEVYSPIILDAGTSNADTVIAAKNNLSSRVLRTTIINDNAHKGMIGVSLDRFDVENGGKYPLVEGNTTQVFKADSHTTVRETRSGSPINLDTHFIMTVDNHYKELANIDDSSATEANAEADSKKAADGSFMVFKPRLFVDGSSGSSSINSSNGILKKHELTVGASNNFLNFIDLTGCYLVQERGTDINGNSVLGGSETNRKCMNNVLTQHMMYVISHEIDESNSSIHHLIMDSSFIAGSHAYRILQPNEVCMHDFTPNKIYMNTLSSSYTKLANKDETYDIKSGYFHREGIKRDADTSTQDEGILSMYMFIDTDRQSSSNSSIAVRGANTFLTQALGLGNHLLYASDGENKRKINIEVEEYASGRARMVLSDTFFSKGIVSFSEPFTVSSRETLKIDPTRACIGSTVSLGLEGEDLINELLEQEGIQFTTTSTDTPMYLAPNYQGVDLYSAIRYILDRKDMKLVEENDVFKIIPEDEDSLRTNITIDDSDEFFITDFDKVSTLFDFFNEVNVYGNAHKAARKDLRSIEKRGRKTLEVVDNTLLTQEEVDKRATKLLRIHSRLNQKLSFTLHSTGISQLRVGDIVNVSIPRENIEMNEYIVLEMEHQISGFIKLQLGRYSKDLSDVFSELLISSKETKAALRSDELTAQEVSFNFLDTVDTKEIKLLVRKRSATGTTLGFATPLGFGLPIGFGGGTITITDLVEEDLA